MEEKEIIAASQEEEQTLQQPIVQQTLKDSRLSNDSVNLLKRRVKISSPHKIEKKVKIGERACDFQLLPEAPHIDYASLLNCQQQQQPSQMIMGSSEKLVSSSKREAPRVVFQSQRALDKENIKQHDRYKTLGESLVNFFSKRSTETAESNVQRGPAKITTPVSPKLHTKERSIAHVVPFNWQASSSNNNNNNSNQSAIIQEGECAPKMVDELENYPYSEQNNKALYQSTALSVTSLLQRYSEKPRIQNVSIQRPVFKEFKLYTEIRGERKREELQQRLDREKHIESQRTNFQAQPLPNYNLLSSQFINSNVKSPNPTRPVQIRFRTDERVSVHAREHSANGENVLQHSEFKARKCPDLSQVDTPRKPTPKKSTLALDVHLSSEARFEKRKQFEEDLKKKIQERQENLSEFSKSRVDQTNEEMKMARSSLSFKAQPIRKYTPIQIHRSEKKLTEPQAPNFKIESRLSIRRQTQGDAQ